MPYIEVYIHKIPSFLARMTHNRGSSIFGRELTISLTGDDKDVSPAFNGLAVIQVAAMASGNVFRAESVTTGTSQL